MRRAPPAVRAAVLTALTAATLTVITHCLLTAVIGNHHVSAETLGAISSLLPPFLVNNFVELVKTASDSCEALPLHALYSRRHTAELPLVEVLEFSRTGRRKHRLSRAHHSIALPPESSALVLYIPGWWNTPTDESSQALVEALLHKHKTVLVLDTRLTFCRFYIDAASRVNPLAYLIFDFIYNLYRIHFPLSAIHLIGFSLGAHVAGITGKIVQKKLNTKIGRITALDPAKPCFVKSLDYRLDRHDAEFVQVVHSSAGVLGLEHPVGHVDIYANGVLVKQPECMDREITIECDHAQSWKLYSASVMNERALMGRECRDWEELISGQCGGNMTVVGYGCSDSARGMFLYKSGPEKKQQLPPKLKMFSLYAQG